ncbi:MULTISPECIES: M4 family metallopeptidase [unclassified Leeuwenhoekiella]|uniref:M4 family metallopeptidase n=1 Tax=unclassified Leeuwenhoekiella TaxID=2615029 RepID=UPI0025C6B1D8|nr:MULTISPECIES: M4 family metallopeptidase [unclassified Leeuwenhoekiella]
MQSKSMTGPRIILGSQLELTDDNTFTQVDLISEKSGMQHQRFDQYYDNVRVEFSSPVIHSEKGTPTAISGEFYAVKDLSTTPAISPQQGFQNALRQIGAQHYLWEYPDAAQEIDYQKPAGELVVLPYITDAGTTMKLAYKYDIYATFPLSRGEVYVDAQKGDVLFYNSIIKHVDSFGHVGEIAATVRTADEAKKALEDYDALAYVTGSAATRYSGTRSIETTLSGGSYILADAGRKLYTRDAKNQAPGSTYPYINNYDQFTDNDNNWTSAEHSANKDDAALDAHWGAMMTYDYFLSQHNRNSFDNNGTQIRSYVHVDVNYDNAFWNGSVMSYGDGSSNGQEGNGYFDALTSLDVAAHEIGHAVCTYTANLAYQRESGGLNEGFSDIWGAAVEFYAKGNGNETNPNPEIWLIGDEIDRRTGSAALRSMSDPKSLGQPDTYGGTYWKNPNCGTPTRTNDYCGVHTNSGVLNHWFYLSSVGGTGTNDVGSSYSVNGIGVTKAARISYRTESLYLSSNSTYADARAASIQAAIDLYGAGSAEEQAVTNAWYAVNVGSAYGETPPVDYCTSQGNSVADEYIGRVQLGSIDNASGATSGYTDHTAVSTELTRGSSATITITPVWRGTVYSEGYAVWIDYNQNGSFTDSGELVFSQGANQNTSVSGSFTVPTSALDGSTRMRVSMKYNGIPSSCETFSYGEVEDYTITFGGGTADTEAPSAPTNLAASNVTETTLDLTWDASTDNVGVTGYDVYQGTSLLGTVTGTSASITGLTADTSYSFSVQAKDAAGNVSASSNNVNVTTAGGTTADTEAPSAPTNLAASNVTETTLDLTWTASTDNVGVTGYDVYQGASLLGTVTGTSASITGLTADTSYSFSVQAKDAAGNVSASSNVVNVTTAGGTTPDTEAPSAPTNLTASNVTETTLDLTWTASTDNVGVTGYDVYQGASLLGSVTGTSASITGLTANTAYTFTVNAKDAAGNSSAGASVNVTTADGGGGPIDDTLIASYFETGWDGWIDGGGDCARYAGSRSPEGSYSIQLRDNSGVASSMTSPVFDLSAYDNVEISFSMYAYSMENGEDFWVRYNDGSGWQTVVAYARGTSFNNNTFYTATVNLPASSYNLSSTGQFRFQCDASANGDLVYIDEVVIRGTATAGVNAIVEAAAPQTFRGESFAEQPDFEGDFVVYPSPAVDLARVQVMLDIEDKPVDVVLSVYDIKGSRILTKEYSNVTEAAFTEELDVTSFKSGVYFVEITAQGGMKETAKFIKK